jgi:hypothetical protein
VRFFVPYFVLVSSVGHSVPERLRFAIIIPLIVVGYSVVAAVLFKWGVTCHEIRRRHGMSM